MIAQLSGFWLFGCEEGQVVCRVADNKLTWADQHGGAETELLEDNGVIAMDLAGVRYSATLDQNKLV